MCSIVLGFVLDRLAFVLELDRLGQYKVEKCQHGRSQNGSGARNHNGSGDRNKNGSGTRNQKSSGTQSAYRVNQLWFSGA